ncbi:hypothetical protein J3R83DRAFT_13477, partial [Lanmaoa asiatica]
ITGIKFSPNGDHLATACANGSIRIFDSHNGGRLIAISVVSFHWSTVTPLAWSTD